LKCIPQLDSTSYSREIDSTDIEIILLVTQGSSSSYSIWTSMKKEAKEKASDKKVMAYININKRISELARMGLLEEIKPDAQTVNIHGRRDYKVTKKGMEQLLPHILEHPEVVENMNEYMDKTGLNRQAFGEKLIDWVETAFKSINGYFESSASELYPVVTRNPAQIERLFLLMKELILKLHDTESELMKQSRQVKSTQSKSFSSSTSSSSPTNYSKPSTTVSRRKKR
jgi:hypothetical protein